MPAHGMLLGLALGLTAAPSTAAGATAFNAGLRVIEIPHRLRSGTEQTLVTAVWYPTEERPPAYTYLAEQPFTSHVAWNARPAARAGRCPLVVFAHGLYGSGFNAAYFMEHLARHGYMAAAADYIDTAPPRYDQPVAFSRIGQGPTGHPAQVVLTAAWFVRDMGCRREAILEYLGRARLAQTSRVIDDLLALGRRPDSPWHGMIDETAIGLCGHSLGAATVLAKAGAHPDPGVRDGRVGAVLAFSGPGFPFETTADRLAVPLMVMLGDDDEPGLCPQVPRRAVFDRAKTPRYLLVLKDATHFTFGNRGGGRLALDQAVEHNVQMRAIVARGLTFFDAYLRHDRQAAAALRKPDPAWVYGVGEDGLGPAFQWGTEPPAGRSGPGGIRKLWQKQGQEK